MKNLIFDTTGIGYFEGGKTVPDAAGLNAMLEKGRITKIKVTRVTEVEIPKAVEIYELSVSGLG